LETLPEGPLVLLANEFLDALPIRQFVWREGRWMERFVGGGRFVECTGTPSPTLPRAGEGAPNSLSRVAGEGWGGGAGTIIELCEAAQSVAASLGRRLSAHPGAALFLDYGPEHSAPGDSLQALREGRPSDPLAAPPGSADLTAHVDFAAFSAAARDAGAPTHGPIPQGLFLARLGLFQRTDFLARTQPPAKVLALIDAARRLAEPNRMGRLFKALALTSRGAPTPPGFE
jgi:SAM-dependent MidA family methyltransferase